MSQVCEFCGKDHSKWSHDFEFEEIKKSLGEDHISWISKLQKPAAYCISRARGWQDANDAELFRMYYCLARHFLLRDK